MLTHLILANILEVCTVVIPRFYKWGNWNWGTEKLSDFPQVRQLIFRAEQSGSKFTLLIALGFLYSVKTYRIAIFVSQQWLHIINFT